MVEVDVGVVGFGKSVPPHLKQKNDCKYFAVLTLILMQRR